MEKGWWPRWGRKRPQHKFHDATIEIWVTAGARLHSTTKTTSSGKCSTQGVEAARGREGEKLWKRTADVRPQAKGE